MRPLPPSEPSSAFSILELIISVGIVALLVTLAIPAAGRFTQSGKQTACMQNLRQLHTAIASYAADHNGEFPVDRFNSATGTSWYGALLGRRGNNYDLENGYIVHAGYGKKRAPFFCPANPTPIVASGSIGWTTYAINSNLYVNDTNSTNDGAEDPNYRERRTAQRMSTVNGNKALLTDACKRSVTPPASTYKIAGARYSNPWSDSHPVHGERVNVLFVDGHIESPRVTPRPAPLVVGADLVEMKAEWFWPLN